MNPNDIRLVHRREQLQLRLQATHDTPKAIDDIVGYIVAQNTGFCKTQRQLYQSTQYYGY